MDVNTGHIVADIKQVLESKRAQYTPIPPHLQALAKKELDGRESAYINPNRAAALAEWAKRKKRKSKARAKLAKASRKRNRA